MTLSPCQVRRAFVDLLSPSFQEGARLRGCQERGLDGADMCTRLCTCVHIGALCPREMAPESPGANLQPVYSCSFASSMADVLRCKKPFCAHCFGGASISKWLRNTVPERGFRSSSCCWSRASLCHWATRCHGCDNGCTFVYILFLSHVSFGACGTFACTRVHLCSSVYLCVDVKFGRGSIPRSREYETEVGQCTSSHLLYKYRD